MLLRNNIYDAVRAAILNWDLRPGQEIREQTLAQQYGVSRSPVRDALLRLEKEHLVTVLPRQGYRINPVSLTDAAEIFAMRVVMEPACCAAAAAIPHAPDPLEAVRDPGEQDFVEYNRAFHVAVAERSGNARMATVTRELVEQSDRLVRVSLTSPAVADRSRLVAEHVAIIDAIVAGDGTTASRLMHDHVSEAGARVLSILGDILRTEA
jgi:GntR family transcriptional regulator, rspAB operon transcriptional repressor